MRTLETPQLEISAPAEVVWSTLLDFPSHARWDSYVVEWSGEARVGARMKLVAKADKRRVFTPVVMDVTAPNRLRYKHAVLGGLLLAADHEIIIEALTATRSAVRQREVFSGLVVRLAWNAIRASAGPGFERMNADLKREAERRAASASAS